MTLSRRQVAGLISLAAFSAGAAEPKLPLIFVDHDVPPNAGRRPDGTVWGRRIAAVRLAAQVAGFSVSVEILPWVRAQEAVRDGTADLLCAPVTPEREAYALFCKNKLMDCRHYFFFRKSGPVAPIVDQIRNKRDLAPFRIATYIGMQFPDLGRVQQPTDVFVPHARQALQMIAADRADIFIGEAEPTGFVLKELNMEDQFDRRELVDPNLTDHHIAVSRARSDAAQIVDRLDRAIDIIFTDGRLTQAIEAEKV
jgi:ABC-type amino acid transport substrate-binding protein